MGFEGKRSFVYIQCDECTYTYFYIYIYIQSDEIAYTFTCIYINMNIYIQYAEFFLSSHVYKYEYISNMPSLHMTNQVNLLHKKIHSSRERARVN